MSQECKEEGDIIKTGVKFATEALLTNNRFSLHLLRDGKKDVTNSGVIRCPSRLAFYQNTCTVKPPSSHCNAETDIRVCYINPGNLNVKTNTEVQTE